MAKPDESSQCPIMIGNNGPVDTSGHEPDPKFDTSLRVLEVCRLLQNEKSVANALVD